MEVVPIHVSLWKIWCLLSISKNLFKMQKHLNFICSSEINPEQFRFGSVVHEILEIVP